MKPLTPRQREIYDWIKNYCEKNSRPPSIRDVGDAHGITAHAAHFHVKAIAKKGWMAQVAKSQARCWVPVNRLVRLGTMGNFSIPIVRG